jgi:Fe2+ or Zn2+ uptake regulation protein
VILDAVMASGGHLTIDQVHRKAREKAPTLNLVTAYRALNFFCGCA